MPLLSLLTIGEIIQLGIPITDKIFVLATSKKVNKEQTQIVTFDEDDCEEVLRINADLANFAYKSIACSDMVFLEKQFPELKKENE